MTDETFCPKRWSERLLDRQDREFAYDGESGAAFEAWQSSFRSALREALGLPVIERTGGCPLEPRRLSVEEREGYDREKWIVQTEADFSVPFYLLRPTEEAPPHPVVLTPHGHNHTGKELYVGEFETDHQREQIVDGERDVAVQAVRRGYAAIAPDMRGLGELAAPADRADGESSCRELQLHAQLFGRTLIGDRVWDVGRLIDFVAEDDGLDEDRIAITGNSGGGTVSFFAAAADERIDVAAPSCYFCSFADSILAMRHCECNYVPGVLQLGEMGDIAGLIAPRPFVAVAGQDDPIFPIEGTRSQFETVAEIYDTVARESHCELYVGDGGHRYYADGVWPFLDEHL
jgi:dienelactone hydrolase